MRKLKIFSFRNINLVLYSVVIFIITVQCSKSPTEPENLKVHLSVKNNWPIVSVEGYQITGGTYDITYDGLLRLTGYKQNLKSDKSNKQITVVVYDVRWTIWGNLAEFKANVEGTIYTYP